MVRAHAKQTPEEKKETHKKKTPSKKKTDTGSWPCKINGCNKVFAREADLKRHQRTTKLHSMPGFACPQCDATFTRTDALRRHQKSRHNGVVMPVDSDKRKGDMDEGSSGSNTPEREETPNKSPEQSSSFKRSPPASLAQPSTSGPNSYYRQHTMTTSSHTPRIYPGMLLDPHYHQSIGPPTSAARLHQATWASASPWGPEGQPIPAGGPMPPGTPLYPPPGYYSPYYRYHPGMPMPPPGHMYPPPPEYMHPHMAPNGMPYPPPPGAVPPPQGEHSPTREGSQVSKDSRESEDAEMEDASSQGSAAVIDPALDGPAPGPAGALHPSAAMEKDPGESRSRGSGRDEDRPIPPDVAEAAVKAVLDAHEAEEAARAKSKQAESQALGAGESGKAMSSQRPPTPPASTSQVPQNVPAPDPPMNDVDADADAEGEVDGEGEGDTARGNVLEQGEDRVPSEAVCANAKATSTQHSDQEVEAYLSEEGVAMLNPAELLTQESLATPPS